MKTSEFNRPACSTEILPGSSGLAIRLDRVTKVFKLYDDPVTGPLKELLFFWRKDGFHRTFKAVDDVTLSVRRGEVVGILGPNGAGKTTLLKVIAGLLPANEGHVEVNGKVTALLALGVGVHPEFSGRENILFNGILLGMSRAEIVEKTPSIIEFAEVGDFIDRPFRTYSTGMKARLLFAISMSFQPDILVVDEALATGDTYFVRKCAKRIRELVDSGATILFVSHNLNQIQQLCDRAYLMVRGRLVCEGAPMQIISEYNRIIFQEERDRLKQWTNPELLLMGGTGEVLLQAIKLRDKDGCETNGFFTGDPMTVEMEYRSFLPHDKPVAIFIGFLESRNLHYIGFYNSDLRGSEKLGLEKIALGRDGRLTVRFDELMLTTNDYALWIILYSDGVEYCEYKGVCPFFVSRRDNVQDRGGFFMHPARISLS